jgi:hypothetical protein
MVDVNKLPPDLIELIGWALDRILSGEYEYAVVDAEGQLETLELGLGLGTKNQPGDPRVIEETLKRILPREQSEAFLLLKEHRTPEKVEGVLRLLFRPDVASRGAQELAGADWSDILRFAQRQFTKPTSLGDRIAELMVKEREGLSSPVVSKNSIALKAE